VVQGVTPANFSNALWKFRSSDSSWGWISGSSISNTSKPGSYGTLGTPSVSNIPSGRELGVSVSLGDCLYIHGGVSASISIYNDLWSYNLTSQMWTWLSGSSSTFQAEIYSNSSNACPGSRYGHSGFSRQQSGSIYIFGGYGRDSQGSSSYLNSLWNYNIASNVWTFVTGSSTGNNPGSYGLLGVSSSTNSPRARQYHQMWFLQNIDQAFLFGGSYYEQNTVVRNDFWRLDLTNSSWTWMGGLNNSASGTPSYGDQTIFTETNYPPARLRATAWSDTYAGSSYLLLFSGQGSQYMLNDLWAYSVDLKMWVWVSGPSYISNSGNFGPKGVEGELYLPALSLHASVGHPNGSLGSFYLYGGSAYLGNSGDDFWILRLKSGMGCPVGYNMLGSVCQVCPVGKFTSVSNSSFCSECPNGTFSLTPKSSSCSNCTAGLYSVNASTTCSSCPKGKFSISGSSSCTSCSPGMFASATGLSTCQNCTAGLFSVVESALCQSCDLGKFSSFGSPSCLSCPLGKFSNKTSSSFCADCGAGTFASNSSSTNCASCTLGRYSSSTGISSCDVCPTNAVTLRSGSTLASSCVCPAGYFGSASFGGNCSVCPAASEGLACPYNSPIPFVYSGFYRSIDITAAYRCIPQKACMETEYNAQTTCSEGYTGFLCGTCVKGSYYRNGLECKRCPNEFQKYIGVIAILIFICAVCGVLMFRKSSSLPIEVKFSFFAIQTLGLFSNVSSNWPPPLASLLSFLSLQS
jgi:hypothetical protein